MSNPVLWALFVLSGLVHGHTLLTSVKGVDPSAALKTGEPASMHYVTTAPWSDATAVDGACQVRLLVVTARGVERRLQVDGVEQSLGWSWSLDYELPEASRREWEVNVIHPVTRASSVRSVSFHCRRHALPDSGYVQPVAPRTH